MLLAWNGRWETRPTATPDVVLELTPGPGGLVVSQARPEVLVNGQAWQAPTPLGPGDRIRFGAGGVEVLSIGSTVAGSRHTSQDPTQSGSGSSLNPSLGSGSASTGGRVAAPSVGSQVGRYLLQEPLGSGQFGTVFRARDTQLGREVALKLLVRATERAQQRFLREVQATAKLQHPHLVTTYDGGELEGWLYLAMEVVIGRTLREAGRDPSVSQEQKIRWIAESARAVAYINGVGVLHRDLKPSNIMIDGEGLARVVDFGMAGIESEETQRLTKTGAALGTPAYMAPEVLYKGGQEAGPPSEVYSLGASLYALLTGRSPREQLNQEPEPFGAVAPEQPEWLIEAVQRAMAFKPEERFADADGFAEALEAGLSTPSVETKAGGPPLAALGVGLALLLGLGGAAAFVATRPSATEASPSPSAGAASSPSATPAPSAAPLSPEQRASAALGALAEARYQEPWEALAPRAEELARAVEALPPDHAARAEASEVLLELDFERGRWGALRERVQATPAFARRSDLFAARVWRALGEGERALGILQALAGEAPEAPAQRAAAALRCLWLGNLDAAARALPSDLPDAGAESAELAWVAARVHLELGAHARARAWLALRAAEDPSWDAILARAEAAADAQAGLAQAEAHLALQVEPAPELLRRVAGLALRAEAWKPAARWLSKIPSARRSPRDLVQLGRALQSSGRPDEAGKAFREAYARDPLSTLRATLGLGEVGRQAWESVSKEGPRDWPLAERSFPAALRALAEGASEPAREPLQAALEASFRGAPWRELEGKVSAALPAAPEDPQTALGCARILVGRDRFERALEVLARARDLDAPASAVERLEAELWLRRGQVDVARRRYAALKAGEDLESRVAQCELGWLQGDAKGGVALGEKLVEEHPDSGPAHLALAVNRINLGQSEEALAALERALALEGGLNARTLMFRALLLARGEGGLVERYGAFEQTFALSEGASPRILAATVALTRREAIPWIQGELRRARAHEPQRPELYLWLGVAGIQSGEDDPSGRQGEVDRLWRELLRIQPGFRIPKSVSEAYRRRYGEPFRK